MLLLHRKSILIQVWTKVELLKHKTGMAMIKGELAALKKLNHPLIISLHFAFHDRFNISSADYFVLVLNTCCFHRRQKCYFIMDLKTGGDLRFYLRQKVTFDERDVAFFVSCISSALHYIHSKNIIHRDIKPGSINPKIDFHFILLKSLSTIA